MWLLYVIRSVIHLHFYVDFTFWEALVGVFSNFSGMPVYLLIYQLGHLRGIPLITLNCKIVSQRRLNSVFHNVDIYVSIFIKLSIFFYFCEFFFFFHSYL